MHNAHYLLCRKTKQWKIVRIRSVSLSALADRSKLLAHEKNDRSRHSLVVQPATGFGPGLGQANLGEVPTAPGVGTNQARQPRRTGIRGLSRIQEKGTLCLCDS